MMSTVRSFTRDVWRIQDVAPVVGTRSFRVALGHYGILCVATALLVAYLGYRSTTVVDEQMLETIDAEIKGLSEQYRQGGVASLGRILNERSRAPGSNLYLLADERGRVLSGNLTMITNSLWDTVGRTHFTYTRDDDRSHKRAAIGVGFRLPEGYRLIVGRDVEDQLKLKRLFHNSVLWSIAGILFAGIAVGVLVSFRSRQLIDSAVETSQRIMRGDLSERLDLGSAGVEYDRLANNLNAMLARIEALVESHREFSDNVAHDLKTPLTRLRAVAELALRQPPTDIDVEDVLASVLTEADELIRTFESILRISRLELGVDSSELRPICLSEIVRDTCELYEPVFEDEGWTVDIELSDHVRINGKEELIRLALSNLIENALRYGAADTRTLSVAAFEDQRHAIVQVADRGPGIPTQDRERVLQRFVRLDSSGALPGNGLGLSLVAAVVGYHGGRLSLEDNHPGLRVVVAFPLRQEVATPSSTE